MPKDQSGAQSATTMQLEMARQAMEAYLQLWQRSLSLTPWANSEQSQKLVEYAHKNIAASFEFAARLAQAKDAGDAVRIQTEFLQLQMQRLTEQVKAMGSAFGKTVAGSSGPSS